MSNDDSALVEDYCSTLLNAQNHLEHGSVNTTRVISLANHGKDFLKSPWGTAIRIECLVVLATANLLFLTVFGSWRNKRKNFITRKVVLAAYTLSSSLISYTLGSMQSSPVKSSVYPIWALSLYILFSSVDSTTAYSLNDNNQSTRQVYTFTLDLIYAVLIAITIPSAVGFYLICPMVLLAMIRFLHRLSATAMARASWNLNKVIADYMGTEHNHGTPYKPCEMEGYRYLVDWPLQDIKLQEDGISYEAPLLTKDANQIVDIEKVWKLNDRSLSPDLKDVCLSFSLFHLLRRRFFGFPCAESSQQKTHDFVFKGLLLDHNGAIGYNRVFKVIEVELAFMYDFFFTKYAVLYYRSCAAQFWSLVTVILMSATIVLVRVWMGFGSDTIEDLCFLINTPTVYINAGITMMIATLIILHEMVQHWLYRRSIWGRVSFVCQHVRKQTSNTRFCSCRMKFLCMDSLGMKLKEIVAKIGARGTKSNKDFPQKKEKYNKGYWQEGLDQYSLLESVGYTRVPSICNPTTVKVQNFCRKFVVNPIPDKVQIFFRRCAVAVYGFLQFVEMAAFRPVGHRRGWIVRKPGNPIKLPVEVKKALVQSLQRSRGNLTNGQSALYSNGADHLLWALRLHEKQVSGIGNSMKTENQTSIILIWHIATCYCEMAASRHAFPGVETELKTHLDVATKLSKYCAYLVVSAPKLLPGHHFDTTVVFDRIAAEASDFLGHAQDKYERMRCSQEAKDRFFHKGMKLGKQLEEMEKCARWKVLAEFWAEILLYLAPSDDVNEHIECLAKGGEFITHLWALLTHAGILDRDPRNIIDIENNASPGAHQPAPATNQLERSGKHVEPAGTAQQQANPLQNVEGTPGVHHAASEIEEIE